MTKAPKKTRLENLCSVSRLALAGVMGMFSFIYLSKTIINDYFHLKNEGRDQGSSNIVLFLLLHSSSLSF